MFFGTGILCICHNVVIFGTFIYLQQMMLSYFHQFPCFHHYKHVNYAK